MDKPTNGRTDRRKVRDSYLDEKTYRAHISKHFITVFEKKWADITVDFFMQENFKNSKAFDETDENTPWAGRTPRTPNRFIWENFLINPTEDIVIVKPDKNTRETSSVTIHYREKKK